MTKIYDTVVLVIIFFPTMSNLTFYTTVSLELQSSLSSSSIIILRYHVPSLSIIITVLVIFLFQDWFLGQFSCPKLRLKHKQILYSTFLAILELCHLMSKPLGKPLINYTLPQIQTQAEQMLHSVKCYDKQCELTVNLLSQEIEAAQKLWHGITMLGLDFSPYSLFCLQPTNENTWEITAK